MNKIVFTLLFLAIQFSINAQTNIGLSFNSVHIGRNISLVASKKINKYTILAGIKYGINSFEHDNQGNLFKKRFFATDFIEHWGLLVGYQHSIKYARPYLEPYWFYELQFTNSHTRGQTFFPVGYDADNNLLYREYIRVFGPTVALENYIGVGLTIQLSDKFFLTQKVGLGMIFYFNTGESYFFKNNSTWEFGYMLSMGAMYRFKEKKAE